MATTCACQHFKPAVHLIGHGDFEKLHSAVVPALYYATQIVVVFSAVSARQFPAIPAVHLEGDGRRGAKTPLSESAAEGRER